MAYLHGVLTTHSFRAEDICTVLADFEMPTSTSEKTSLLHMIKIFKCKEGFDLHFDAVMTLMKILGSENYGQQLALFMHYELACRCRSSTASARAARSMDFTVQ
jgi:hypothetical protein